MQTREFLLLAYLALGGEVSGKTALQKKIYFLGEITGFEAGFEAHYYGPYSSEVAGANSELKSLGYVKQSANYWGRTSPNGFEIVRYDYQLTDAGKKVAEQKRQRFTEEWKPIEAATQKMVEAEKGGSLDYMGLAAAAKAHFLIKQKGGTAYPTEIREMARQFNWSLSEQEVERAGDFLVQIGLVTQG